MVHIHPITPLLLLLLALSELMPRLLLLLHQLSLQPLQQGRPAAGWLLSYLAAARLQRRAGSLHQQQEGWPRGR